MSVSIMRRRALAFGLTLGSAAVLAQLARPRSGVGARARVPLEAMFPAQVAGWVVNGMSQAFVQPHDDHGRVYGIYDQVLERVYTHTNGDCVMLCVAYGSDQSPMLQVHNPEVCYASLGFQVDGLREDVLQLHSRTLPVRRLHAVMVGRSEPITYWTVLGDEVVNDSHAFRWRQVSFALNRGAIDGMLVRISSIDREAAHGWRAHARFADDLLGAMAPAHRERVFGAQPTQA